MKICSRGVQNVVKAEIGCAKMVSNISEISKDNEAYGSYGAYGQNTEKNDNALAQGLSNSSEMFMENEKHHAQWLSDGSEM